MYDTKIQLSPFSLKFCDSLDKLLTDTVYEIHLFYVENELNCSGPFYTLYWSYNNNLQIIITSENRV